MLLRSVLYLFRTGPISFNLFQRLPSSLRHEFPDNQHIRHAHEGEQEENEQEEAGYSQGISEEEIQADENQRNNHSRNSVINKFLAAYLINDDKSQNGGQSID